MTTDSRTIDGCDNCGKGYCKTRERWRTLPIAQANFLDKLLLLPVELQEMILRYYITTDRPKDEGMTPVVRCCPPALVKVNKFWNDKISPLLWEVIQHDEVMNIAGVLSVLIGIRRTHPSRFERLTGFVKILDLGTLDGAALGPGDPSLEQGHFIDDVDNDQTQWVYNIISHFKNLRQFKIYVLSDSTNIRNDREAIYKRLETNFTKLETLHVGGVIPAPILSSIFSGCASTLRHVKMINLHQSIWRGEDTPEASRPYADGVNHGPDGILFLTDDICQRMTSLQTLHLCKLADLEPISPSILWDTRYGVSETASGLSCPFARSSELEILQEWAHLLRYAAPYLDHLTLENRFLVSLDTLFFQSGDDLKTFLQHANISVQASRDTLMPLFDNASSWPNLGGLHLSGMAARGESVGDWAKNLDGVVKVRMPVRFQLAGITSWGGNVESITHVSGPDMVLGLADLTDDPDDEDRNVATLAGFDVEQSI